MSRERGPRNRTSKTSFIDWRDFWTQVAAGLVVVGLLALIALLWTGVIDIGGSSEPTASERSPARGTAAIGENSSREFFGGKFVVSMGAMGSRLIDGVVLPVVGADRPCNYDAGSVGSGLMIRRGGWSYGIEVRALTSSHGACVVVTRPVGTDNSKNDAIDQTTARRAHVVARRYADEDDDACFLFEIGLRRPSTP